MPQFVEVIVAPGHFEGDSEQAVRKLYTAVARAADKYESPIQMRLSDGRDHEIAAYLLALDEQGNVATVIRAGKSRELDAEGVLAGLFVSLTDRVGSTRTFKIIIKSELASS